MNTLYTLFAKQVQNYCKESTQGDASVCKKNMMTYGVAKLNDMEESHLDTMDPYQRNADDIRKSINFSPLHLAIGAEPADLFALMLGKADNHQRRSNLAINRARFSTKSC